MAKKTMLLQGILDEEQVVKEKETVEKLRLQQEEELRVKAELQSRE